jgi:outer membrane protein OmpA-like peptidoglycan-associated protein
MKKWSLIGICGVILIWLLASLWLLPQTSRSLENHAQSLLSDLKHQGAFSDTRVTFSGQEALLTGTVGSSEDRLLAGEITANQVRARGELGEKWNPVTAVENQLRVDSTWNQDHPKPWLGAILFENEIKLSGILSSSELADKAAGALKSKSSGTAVADLTLIRAGTRPALDWDATLANAPDLKSLPNAAKSGAAALTACDGQWTLLPGDSDDAKIRELASASGVPPSEALGLINQLRELGAQKAEKHRIASLPVAYSAVSVLPDAVHCYGHVFDTNEKSRLRESLANAFPSRTLQDHVVASGDVRPEADWTVPLKSLPLDKENSYSFSMVPGEKASLWTTGGTLAEMTQSLSPRLPATFEAYPPLYAHYDGWRKDVLAKEAKVLAEAQTKAAAAAAAEVAALSMANSKTQAAKRVPGYVGWTLDSKRLDLFGALPDESIKNKAIEAAKSAFDGMTVSSDGLLVDTQKAPSTSSSISFEKSSDPSKPAIGLTEVGGLSKAYAANVFDSEIAKDFPGLELNEGELSKSLQAFRTRLVESKILSLDDPYLSVISDGKTLTLAGEVADEETKRSTIDALKNANSDFQINDQITITPLVKGSLAPKITLDSTPSFKKGESGVAMATLGQKWRTAVVHSIHFQTGSNRSKDQERALYQIRRVLKINPAAKFEIAGHTDNVGSEDSNIKLSQKRASNVAKGLSENGIDLSILTTRGAGPKEPVADQSTDEGKAQNRRVDVRLK